MLTFNARQLLDTERAAQVRLEEYQEKLLQVFNPQDRQQVTKLTNELEKTRKSESKWQRECQSLVYKLDLEECLFSYSD